MVTQATAQHFAWGQFAACSQRRHAMRPYLTAIAIIISLLCAYVALVPLVA
jgi:hypothetical protein